MATIRFICIDDHPVISDAIGRAAADYDDLELLGAFTSIESVPKPLRSPDNFDVALLDLSLPGAAGIDGVRAVVAWGVKVLVYTATAGSRHAEMVLASMEEAVAWAARIAKACRCGQELRVFMFDPQS